MGTASGHTEVLDATVNIAVELPGFLGQIDGVFRDRLKKAGQQLLLLGKN